MNIGQAQKGVDDAVKRAKDKINQQVLSRATRVSNALMSAELRVLSGQRSGKVYRKPNAYGSPTEGTKKLGKKYGCRIKEGQLYQASAPGEAPAERLGDLKKSWMTGTDARTGNRGISVTSYIESKLPYASMLEKGTSKMAQRPYAERIKEEARLEIEKIMSEPYT